MKSHDTNCLLLGGKRSVNLLYCWMVRDQSIFFFYCWAVRDQSSLLLDGKRSIFCSAGC